MYTKLIYYSRIWILNRQKNEQNWGSINIAIQPNVRIHKYRKIRNIKYIKVFSFLSKV